MRISGIASTWVTTMPAKPRLVPDPHEIYQKVKVAIERRVLGGWKRDQKTFSTRRTVKGQVNSGRSVHSAPYGPATADGATFRIRLIVRVYTHRAGLPDRLHWKYQVYSQEFSCPLSDLITGRNGR